MIVICGALFQAWRLGPHIDLLLCHESNFNILCSLSRCHVRVLLIFWNLLFSHAFFVGRICSIPLHILILLFNSSFNFPIAWTAPFSYFFFQRTPELHSTRRLREPLMTSLYDPHDVTLQEQQKREETQMFSFLKVSSRPVRLNRGTSYCCGHCSGVGAF